MNEKHVILVFNPPDGAYDELEKARRQTAHSRDDILDAVNGAVAVRASNLGWPPPVQEAIGELWWEIPDPQIDQIDTVIALLRREFDVCEVEVIGQAQWADMMRESFYVVGKDYEP